MKSDLATQLRKVSSVGVVRDGKVVGEYDPEHYLIALEGKKVRWTLEVVDSPSQ